MYSKKKFQSKPEYVSLSKFTRLARCGIVIDEMIVAERKPLTRNSPKSIIKPKEEKTPRDDKRQVYHMKSTVNTLNLAEIEVCKRAFTAAGGVKVSDISAIEELLDGLGTPVESLIEITDVIGTLYDSTPYNDNTEMDSFMFLKMMHELKRRHQTAEEERSCGHQADAVFDLLGTQSDGTLQAAKLADFADKYQLRVVGLSRESDSLTKSQYTSLLCSNQSRAEELFVDFGASPTSPTNSTIQMSSIEQQLHLFGQTSAAMEVVQLARLLCGDEVSFTEFKDLIFSPIHAAAADPSSISNIREQLSMAKGFQKFVEFGVDMVRKEHTPETDSKVEANKLFSILKYCHWKGNKQAMSLENDDLASDTLNQALKVVIDTHRAKEKKMNRDDKGVRKAKWKSAVEEGIRRISKAETDDQPNKVIDDAAQREQLKRAALAMMLQNTVSGSVPEQSQSQSDVKPPSASRNLFLKSINAATKKAANKLLEDTSTLDFKEAANDTAQQRGRRISRIINTFKVPLKNMKSSHPSESDDEKVDEDSTTPHSNHRHISIVNQLTTDNNESLTTAIRELCLPADDLSELDEPNEEVESPPPIGITDIIKDTLSQVVSPLRDSNSEMIKINNIVSVDSLPEEQVESNAVDDLLSDFTSFGIASPQESECSSKTQIAEGLKSIQPHESREVVSPSEFNSSAEIIIHSIHSEDQNEVQHPQREEFISTTGESAADIKTSAVTKSQSITNRESTQPTSGKKWQQNVRRIPKPHRAVAKYETQNTVVDEPKLIQKKKKKMSRTRSLSQLLYDMCPQPPKCKKGKASRPKPLKLLRHVPQNDNFEVREKQSKYVPAAADNINAVTKFSERPPRSIGYGGGGIGVLVAQIAAGRQDFYPISC